MTFLYYTFSIGVGLFLLGFGLATFSCSIAIASYFVNAIVENVVDFLIVWKYRKNSLELPEVTDEYNGIRI